MHKISIISRGQALGYTISLPTEDKFLTTRAELADTLAMTLGGRAAEEIVFGEITTGAANDLEKVTATAKQMVMRFGMSEKLGPRTFGHDQSQPFLGREFSAEPPTTRTRSPARSTTRSGASSRRPTRPRAQVLSEHRDDLDRLSKLLLEHETIEREEFEALLAGKSEEEVFGAPEAEQEPPPPPAEAERRRPVAQPRPLPQPRPGLAGGPEMRGDRALARPPAIVGASADLGLAPRGHVVRRLRSRSRFARPAVMGVLNVTPDSFSDGGEFLDPRAAVAHARAHGGRGRRPRRRRRASRRGPGAEPVPADEELRRVMPVIEAARAGGAVPLSIDTSKAAVARAALDAGAVLVNDVTALRGDPGDGRRSWPSPAPTCA